MFTAVLLLVSSLLFSYKWGKIEKSHSNTPIFSLSPSTELFHIQCLNFSYGHQTLKAFSLPIFVSHAIDMY